MLNEYNVTIFLHINWEALGIVRFVISCFFRFINRLNAHNGISPYDEHQYKNSSSHNLLPPITLIKHVMYVIVTLNISSKLTLQVIFTVSLATSVCGLTPVSVSIAIKCLINDYKRNDGCCYKHERLWSAN